MTAVRLKSKSSVSTETWSNIFTGFNTDTKSCLFMKQLTSTCISTILYLRKVLPDDYFEEKAFEGMTLKLLKSRKGENYVSKIEQWLEGAFEALEKKYLKGLMLDIEDAESNMTLEIYTMTFNYNNENEGLNPLTSGTASNNKSGFPQSDTKLSTIKLLQMCYAVTQTYSNLPAQVKLSMRLSYYETTPQDYHPKGYMAWEPTDPKFPKQARSIEIGTTSTQHHYFKFFNKLCLSDKFFQDLEEHLEKSSVSRVTGTDNKQENVSVERPTKAKRELRFENPKKSVQSTLLVAPKAKAQTTFIVSENCTSVSSKQTKSHKPLKKITESKAGVAKTKETNLSKKADIRNQNVRCACLSSDRTRTMFPCLGCRFLVHAECYGILQFDPTKKVRFYCHLCHQTESNSKCHDKVIMSLKNSSDQQVSNSASDSSTRSNGKSLSLTCMGLYNHESKLSLLRRILRHCNMPYIHTTTLKKMEKILGSSCPTNLVNIVLNKMVEIGVAVPQGRKTYLIDKQTLANKLVHYFYKMHNSSQNHSQTIPYSLRPLENVKRRNYHHEFSNRNKFSRIAIQDLTGQNSQQSCDIFC